VDFRILRGLGCLLEQAAPLPMGRLHGLPMRLAFLLVCHPGLEFAWELGLGRLPAATLASQCRVGVNQDRGAGDKARHCGGKEDSFQHEITPFGL
jgi:hypothetical protein